MKPLNIHYFQHVPFEGLGIIESWAEENNHRLTATKFYQQAELPSLNDIDWLVIMGGPMGVYDEEKYPWLQEEKKFIQQAIQAHKIVIGICLGAQLIADVLGAKVYPNKEKEIGWFDVRLTQKGTQQKLFADFPEQFTTFHWHGDTFELPEGAVHLAQTSPCKNQAFLYQDWVLGLQFHFEVTKDAVAKMLEHGRHELVEAPFIQSAGEILSVPESLMQENAQRLKTILSQMQGGGKPCSLETV